MNDRERIAATENRLQERILSISTRLQRIKYGTYIPDPNSPYILNTDDSESRNLKITPGQVDFYDDNWVDVLKLVKDKNYEAALQSFVQTFQDLSTQKVDLSEIHEKSDRQYVDSLIDDINSSVQNLLNDTIQTTYSDIKDELQQAKQNVETIRQQVDQNIELLKKELHKTKKSILDPKVNLVETENIINNTHEIQKNKTIQKTFQKNRLILVPPISKRPHLYKDGIKKRTKTSINIPKNFKISGISYLE